MDSSTAKNEIANLKFDLVQKGSEGNFDILPVDIDEKDEGPSSTFPLVTLPAGIPPVLLSLESEVENLLTSPECLPMHHFSNCQRFIPREPQYDRLLHAELCPLLTTIQAERDPRNGKLLRFNEELIPDSSDTPRNSLSMRRAPDISSARCQQDLRGSSGNLPFWPGGMENEKVEDLDLNDLLTETAQTTEEKDQLNLQLHNENNYLTTPPGFETGMKFSTKDINLTLGKDSQSAKANELDTQTGSSSGHVVSLADIMAGVDDLDFGDSDDDEEEGKQQETPLTDESDAVDVSNMEGPANLENLVQVPEREETEIKKPVLLPKKYEWSVNLDTNEPVHDFYKRIPDMAYKWPFELDIFQKQAILCLENHESVFVAAHTSAGKTVVAEYAIALSMKHMTKTIYTSPIKALSNQKYRDFKLTFGDVGLVTGDVQLNQTASCLIMTTEILRSMLYNGSDVIRDLEWVIFDEVHYINDSERGVVWEEVLIMLPSHVNVILLSATVPNTMEFADWVGRTKKKKIYVVSTPRRPVPLEHFLYTGNSMKTINELFLLMDAKGSFLTTGYNKALEAKKERASKASQSFGAKGPRAGNPGQDKNVWLSVIEMLKKKDKLPAVAFTFSRKRLEETATCLSTVDLTTGSEKNEIHVFFQKCIVRLKGTDKDLPQVMQLKDLLRRGLGIHHSGVLPILKEMVEMLFQRGLLKILFATETFAMGVNMPARTVLFEHIRKHDGLNFRNLLAGEYIQMAGRAGRRGLDTTGTVILICKGDVPEMSELHKMMLGKATSLESQFRLTYTMILNLMRVEQLRVQDMMKRSFSEFHHQKETVTHRQELDKLKEKIKFIRNIECYLCALDLENYYEDCREIHRLRCYLQPIIFSHPVAVQALSPGRVVMVKKDSSGQYSLGVVLASSGNQDKKKFTILFLAERTMNSKKSSQENKSTQEKTEGIQPVLSTSLFLPEGQIWHSLQETNSQDISCITTKTIKVDADGIIRDCKRREIPRFKDDPPDHCVSSVAQNLARLTEGNPGGLPGLHPINDLKLRDLDLVEQCRALQFLEEGVSNFNCTRCPDFKKHFSEHGFNMGLKDEYKRLQFLLSEESLSLLPEYTQRAEVLKRLHYLDANGTVQLKGRVACEMSNHELMITEMIFENMLTDLPASEIAALMSCFVFESRKCSEPNLTDELKKSQKKILAMAERIGLVQKEVGMLMPVEDYKEQFHFGLMEVVFEWARGMPFSEITTLTDVQEGIIVRTIQRLHELLKDVRNAARLVGDRTLAEKMEESMILIKRDIVFAASLYTQ